MSFSSSSLPVVGSYVVCSIIGFERAMRCQVEDVRNAEYIFVRTADLADAGTPFCLDASKVEPIADYSTLVYRGSLA